MSRADQRNAPIQISRKHTARRPVASVEDTEPIAEVAKMPDAKYTWPKAAADIVIGFQKGNRHGLALVALFAILVTVLLLVLLPSSGIVGGLVRRFG